MYARKTLITAATAVAIGLGGTAIMMHQSADAQASKQEQKEPARAGKRRAGKHHGMARMCSPHRAERVERMIDFADSFMSFTAPQQQAFDDLTVSLRTANTRMDRTCAQAKADDSPGNATARLAKLETFLSAGLQSVQEIRPSFDKFYDSLSAKQQKSLDDMLNRRGHRGRGHRR